MCSNTKVFTVSYIKQYDRYELFPPNITKKSFSRTFPYLFLCFFLSFFSYSLPLHICIHTVTSIILATYWAVNVDRVARPVQRLTTGWTVRDRIPVGTRFSARPDRPWSPPSLLYNGYRVFPGGKVRPGRAADGSPPSSATVMEEQSCTSTHPLGHTGPVTGSLKNVT